MNKYSVALGGVMVFSLAMRLWTLPWGFITDRELGYAMSVDDDERRTVRSLRDLGLKPLRLNPKDNQREGSLFPYVLGSSLVAAKSVGYVTLTTDEAFYRAHPEEMKKIFMVGRLAAIATSLAGMVLLYAIGKHLWSPETGLYAALLFSVFPILFHYDTRVSAQNLASLLAIGTLYCALRIAEGNDRKKWYMWGGLAAGFSFTARISMFVSFGMLGAASAVRACASDATELRQLAAKIPIGRLALAGTLSLAGVLIGNPSLLLDTRQVIDSWRNIAGYGGNFFDVITHLAALKPLFAQTLPAAMTWPFLGLAIIGLFFAIRKKLPIAWIGLGFIIPYWYLMLGASYAYAPRQIIPLLPLGALFAAYATTELWQKVRNGAYKSLFLVAILSAFTWAILYQIAYTKAALKMHPFENLAQWIEKNIPADATIGITRKTAYFKVIDFARYGNTYELREDLGGIAELREPPEYVIVFQYPTGLDPEPAVKDPDRVIRGTLHAHGYAEIAHFENPVTLGTLPFQNPENYFINTGSWVYARSH